MFWKLITAYCIVHVENTPIHLTKETLDMVVSHQQSIYNDMIEQSSTYTGWYAKHLLSFIEWNHKMQITQPFGNSVCKKKTIHINWFCIVIKNHENTCLLIDITDPTDKASTTHKTFETLSKYKMWQLKTITLSVAIRAKRCK